MNKYAHLAGPQAELDFHGKGVLNPKQISQMLDQFLEDSYSKGLSKVLVVTGKGMHSKNGAVVKPTVIKHLANHELVESANSARRDRGGDGALEVRLIKA